MTDNMPHLYDAYTNGIYTGKTLLWLDYDHGLIEREFDALRNMGLCIVATGSVACAADYLEGQDDKRKIDYLVSALICVDNDVGKLLLPSGLNIPNLTGLDFIDFAHKNYPDMPIGAFTAVTDADTKDAATKEYNLSFWVGKPGFITGAIMKNWKP